MKLFILNAKKKKMSADMLTVQSILLKEQHISVLTFK